MKRLSQVLLKTHQNKFINRVVLTLLLTSFFCQTFAQEEQVNNTPEAHQANSVKASNVKANDINANSAEAWLAKMSNAVKTLNYSVSFVLLKPRVDSQPYIWRHGVTDNGTEMEHLNLLNGPGREIIRIGNKVSYFEPNVPPYSLLSSIINGPFPSELFQHPEKLAVGYEFVLVGRSRISGRVAQQIRIISKDKSRFGLTLWLDQETGLLLKMNMLNLESQLLEQIQVTGLQVTKDPDPFFAKVEAEVLPEVVNFGGAEPLNSPWKINYMPPGMSIVKRDLRRLSTTGDVVEYIMLSDGLVDVSVYLQQRGNNKVLENLVGTVQSDTLLTYQHEGIDITVIGKLPAGTANNIAKSIQRVN